MNQGRSYGVFAGNVQFQPGDYFLESAATLPAGTVVSQAGSAVAPIVTQLVNITAGAAGSAQLPLSASGNSITVHNISASNVTVYPAPGGSETINALSANAGIVMATNTSTTFTCVASGQWYTVPRVPS
jgi:hypothetical protein